MNEHSHTHNQPTQQTHLTNGVRTSPTTTLNWRIFTNEIGKKSRNGVSPATRFSPSTTSASFFSRLKVPPINIYISLYILNPSTICTDITAKSTTPRLCKGAKRLEVEKEIELSSLTHLRGKGRSPSRILPELGITEAEEKFHKEKTGSQTSVIQVSKKKSTRSSQFESGKRDVLE